MLADIGKIAGADHDRVAKFVNDGGVLIRFAGARMTDAVDDLMPVKLRVGGRYLGGALAWAEPQHLARISRKQVPFTRFAIPHDVTVSRQVLAEPSVELRTAPGRGWPTARRLSPPSSAAKAGSCCSISRASPAWSSLPLSGLYVDMLRRLLELADGIAARQLSAQMSRIATRAETLDGFGQSAQSARRRLLPLRATGLGKRSLRACIRRAITARRRRIRAQRHRARIRILTPMGDLGRVCEYLRDEQRALSLGATVLAIALLHSCWSMRLISLALRGYLTLPRAVLRAAAPCSALAVLLLGRATRAPTMHST